MTRWRKKEMALADWSAFQDRFGDYQLLTGGDERLAMFIKGKGWEDTQTIFVTAPDLAAIERLSPGGWHDADKPEGDDVGLLVGSGDPWEFLGIEGRKREPR